MRPLKLAMCAFGPYAHETHVDFDTLGTSGVYLVCGNTGSGKTFIFDAICFALFGEASGDAKGGARTAASLRSDYAEATADTYVELLFEYRAKRYRVRRNPEYDRPKKRAEGFTRQPSRAELEYEDGATVTGVRNVDGAVEELLGISAAQFKQIVMLAQGEFRRLLTAETSEREVILRKLFATERYEAIQDKLAEQCRKLERANDALHARIDALAGRASFGQDDDGPHRGEFGAPQGLLGVRLLEALDVQLQHDKPAYERLLAEVEELRGKWAEAKVVLGQVQGRGQIEEEKASLEVRLAGLKRDAAMLEEAFQAEVARDAERAGLADGAARLAGTLGKYRQLDEARAALAAKRDEEEQTRLACEQASGAYEQKSEKLSSLVSEIAGLDGADVRLAKAKAEVDSAENEVAAAKRVLADAREVEALSRDAARAREELDAALEEMRACEAASRQAQERLAETQATLAGYADAAAALAQCEAAFALARKQLEEIERLEERRRKLAADLDEAKSPYVQAQEEFREKERVHDIDLRRLSDLQKRQRAGRAGLLAADLMEGAACPVCGSRDHPSPAPASDRIPTDEQVDAASKAERASAKQANEASSRAEQLGAVLEVKRRLLEEFDGEHDCAEALDERLSSARSVLDDARDTRQFALGRVEEAKSARADHDSALAEQARAAELSKAADEAFRNRREGLVAAQAALEARGKTLSVHDAAEAGERLSALEERLAKAKAEFSAAERESRLLGDLRRSRSALERDLADKGARREETRELARGAAESARIAAERVNQLEGDLEFESFEEASGRVRELSERAARLTALREEAQKALQQNASELSTAEELLKALDRRLSALPSADPDETKALMDEITRKANGLNAQAAALKTRIDVNAGCREDLQAALDEAGDIQQRYGRVKELAEVATGVLANKAKIRFEAYVQSIYFDKVIAAANMRLKLLTSGQFELVRYAGGSGNAKTGLDLFVFDSFTGRMRDASSLSGGESFQASLCLALGLSDTVQAHAGGIEFDTMFVDEGFGSLDQGALGNAISLLSDLSGGTKLIGIISHVEDLKANIPKKIVVEKTPEGSSLSLET